jgi:hypothetical protein
VRKCKAPSSREDEGVLGSEQSGLMEENTVRIRTISRVKSRRSDVQGCSF